MINPKTESGYDAWVRYPFNEEKSTLYKSFNLEKIHLSIAGPCAESIEKEWTRAIHGILNKPTQLVDHEKSSVCYEINSDLKEEQFHIQYKEKIIIQSGSTRGLLYATFHCLQSLQMGITKLSDLEIQSSPEIPIRMLNHWDNIIEDPAHGSIERVFGGKSIFDWTDLSSHNSRYEDYARILASVGINGTCINNVNAIPEILSSSMIQGLSSLAEILRRWGIRLYVSIDYSSPVILDGLANADPLNPDVQKWWKDKVAEIYASIPDFGGFVIKADSEGRPGPGDYGRNHIEGSQCIARALKPWGGTLFWRAFVYGRDIASKTPHDRAAADRANHASYEFMELDGKFDSNVILQVKLSATDFQMWEPPHALLAKMPNTRIALEMQITQEYSGLDTHIAWAGKYWHSLLNCEVLEGQNNRVVDIISGKRNPNLPGAITAIPNISTARNWFGHLLGGANFFAFGKLGWSSQHPPEQIAKDYSTLLFGNEVANDVSEILLQSYNTTSKYMSFFGVGSYCEHLLHYEPDPWHAKKDTGTSKNGIGHNRTSQNGSSYTELYSKKLCDFYENISTCPEENILYFNQLKWEAILPSGKTVIQTLYDRLCEGTNEVYQFREKWLHLHGKIDLERWAHVFEKLNHQMQHAEKWRDHMFHFFLEMSGIEDKQKRFSLKTPSTHPRIRSAFPQAVEDYIARVRRQREQIQSTVITQKDFE